MPGHLVEHSSGDAVLMVRWPSISQVIHDDLGQLFSTTPDNWPEKRVSRRDGISPYIFFYFVYISVIFHCGREE
jgi:hypothetical protein